MKPRRHLSPAAPQWCALRNGPGGVRRPGRFATVDRRYFGSVFSGPVTVNVPVTPPSDSPGCVPPTATA